MRKNPEVYQEQPALGKLAGKNVFQGV
jgi:hypothetical protein